MSAGQEQSLRRTLLMTPIVFALGALLIWTLAHTDIVAFATVSLATLVLVSGTFWRLDPGQIL